MEITKEDIINKILSLIPKERRDNEETIESAKYIASTILRNKEHKWKLKTGMQIQYICEECFMTGSIDGSNPNLIIGDENMSCADKIIQDILI